MKKTILFMAGLSLVSTPAVSQVRPQECRPLLPLVDEVKTAALPDIVAEPAVPTAAVNRGFFGIPFLLPLLGALGGVIAAIGGGGGGGGGDTPQPPVSPA